MIQPDDFCSEVDNVAGRAVSAGKLVGSEVGILRIGKAVIVAVLATRVGVIVGGVFVELHPTISTQVKPNRNSVCKLNLFCLC